MRLDIATNHCRIANETCAAQLIEILIGNYGTEIVMKTIYLIALMSSLLILNAAAQTTAIGKYRTSENLEKAFLSNLRTIPLTKFTIKSSDKAQGTIQGIQIDKTGRHEFASLFIMVTSEGTNVLIEATFTRNAGYIGGGKPLDWAKQYGEKLKAQLPDVKVEIAEAPKN